MIEWLLNQSRKIIDLFHDIKGIQKSVACVIKRFSMHAYNLLNSIQTIVFVFQLSQIQFCNFKCSQKLECKPKINMNVRKYFKGMSY